MIPALEKAIRSHIPGAARVAAFDLLKFSTPGSARGLYPKVIFFVFARGKARPRYVVKTVRSSGLNTIIERGYQRLSDLDNMVAGTPLAGLFPQALLIDSYEGIAFSVESAADGRRARAGDDDLIIDSYQHFQQSIASAHKSRVDARTHAKGILAPSDLGRSDMDELDGYTDSLFGEKETVASLPQHGDMTLDNIFIEKGKVRMVDCDNTAEAMIAGYDLCHFLKRLDGGPSFGRSLPRFDEYFKMIGEQSWNRRGCAWIYFLIEHRVKRWKLLPAGAAGIIAAFEKSVNGCDNTASA